MNKTKQRIFIRETKDIPKKVSRLERYSNLDYAKFEINRNAILFLGQDFPRHFQYGLFMNDSNKALKKIYNYHYLDNCRLIEETTKRIIIRADVKETIRYKRTFWFTESEIVIPSEIYFMFDDDECATLKLELLGEYADHKGTFIKEKIK